MVSTWNCTSSPKESRTVVLLSKTKGLNPRQKGENPSRGGLGHSWLVRDSNSLTVYANKTQNPVFPYSKQPSTASKSTFNCISKHQNTEREAHKTAHGLIVFRQTNLHESGYLDTTINLSCTRDKPLVKATGLSTPNEGASDA